MRSAAQQDLDVHSISERGRLRQQGLGENLGVEDPGHPLRPRAVIDHRGFRSEIDVVADPGNIEAFPE